MALTKTQVSELYVAIFGRASEGEGNKYWQTVDASAAEIADEMLTTTPAQEYFGETLNSPLEFIKHIYLNTLGRTYEDDAEGIDYWSGRLEAGESHGAIVVELISVLQNSENTGNAQDSFKNRVEVSNYTADNLFAVPADVDTALSFSAEGLNVNEDPATVEAANRKVDAIAQGEGEEPGEPEEPGVEGEEFFLELGRDNLTGTDGDDTFTAYIENNSNTLQNGDVINGGAGEDTLYAEIGNSQSFAIQPRLNSVENVVVSARTIGLDWADNNLDSGRGVQIDAGLSRGVTNWESNDSRADLIIEDVRINSSQVTKDVTVTFRDSDPGNVDYAVYFDQQSLISEAPVTDNRLVLSMSNQLDVGDGFNPDTPLQDIPYTHFNFELNGVVETVALDLDGALTYDDLEAALAEAFAAYPEVTIERAENAQNFFSYNGTPRTADLFTLTVSDGTIEAAQPGWNAEGGLPSDNSFSARVSTGPAETSDPLITSTIVLDNVGRGSTGGDLVIGGLSAGNTSTSTGVEQFDITVEQSSKLQFLGSTADTLEVVNLVNDGVHPDVIDGKVVNQVGNLTLQGAVNVAGFGFGTATGKAPLTWDRRNQDLIGADGQESGFGLVNVREVNAENFQGNIALTAQLNSDVTDKYMTLNDQATDPAAADNVLFEYNLGSGDDRLSLAIDSANLEAAGTATREDFELMIDTGAGSDIIEVAIYDETFGGAVNNLDNGNGANWYANSTLNANLAIEAGAGDDVVITNGSGNWFIDLGEGDDVLYANVDTALTSPNALWVFNAVVPAAATAPSPEVLAALQQDVQDAQAVVALALRTPEALAAAQAAVAALEAQIGVASDDTATPPVEATGLTLAAEQAAAALTEAQDELDDLETARDVAQTAAEQAGATPEEIQAYIDAQAAVEAQQALIGDADSGLVQADADATAALTEATTALGAAQADVATAESIFSATELASAEDALATAQDALAAAQAQVDGISDIDDLLSGANTQFGSLFKSDLTVEFKGFEATVELGLGTNDVLGVNQAIKQAIQTDPVLSKLLAVQDGPANTLVIASLIDGDLSEDGISVSIAAPSATDFSQADVSAYNAAYSANVANVQALEGVIANSVTASDAYTGVDAEQLVGGTDSAHVADNTINAGTGFDVLVLGTGENSNDTVVFEGTFGTNNILHFQAGALADEAGRDVLDFQSYDVDGVAGLGVNLGATSGNNVEYIQFNAVGSNAGAYNVIKVTNNAEGASTTETLGVVDFGDADLTGFVEENFVF